MTGRHPSRLANVLLQRLALDNEPLAGDIIEEFGRRQSHIWLWRQLLVALATQALYAPHPPVSLNLTPIDPVVAAWLMEKHLEKNRKVSLTGTGIEGVGGLTMVVLGFIVSMVSPALWWLVVGGIAGGVVVGLALILLQRQVFSPAPRVLFSGVGSHPDAP